MPKRKQIHGAKWWKFDFHTHTPASNDFGKGDAAIKSMSPIEWLLMFMRAEIDCVAVTDHNSGEWIDKLKLALEQLKQEAHPEFRDIYLFPGVEISVHGNCHVLAIFDTTAGTKEITTLLGSLDFPAPDFGTSDTVTKESITFVLEAIIKAGAIAIPAHVDKPCGLFKKVEGTTLTQALQVEGLLAVELVDQTFTKPNLYLQSKLNLTEVIGTDMHLPTQVGTNFTWVKMHEPSLDALRLALHDGEDGVIRKSEITTDPNLVKNRYFIKSLIVKDAYKAGRTIPLIAKFSPWLSSVIGGRGCGKSSLINFLRLALCRHFDMPENIQQEFNLFRKVGSKESAGMLTQNTIIKVEVCKDGNLYTVSWFCKDDKFLIQEWNEKEANWSNPIEITNIADLFPIQIFSQKELYALTNNPSKLIDLIDSQFDKEKWVKEKEALMTKWLANRLKERELKTLIGEEKNIETQLSSISSRIKLYESSDYKDTLSEFNSFSSINSFFKTTSSDIENVINEIETLNKKIPIIETPKEIETILDEASLTFIDQWKANLNEVTVKANEMLKVLSIYKGNALDQAEKMPWKSKFDSIHTAYDAIVDKIKELGSESYESLIKKRADLSLALEHIKTSKETLKEQKETNSAIYQKIIDHEKRLRTLRQGVIDKWKNLGAGEQPFLMVELCPMCNSIHANRSFRELLRKPGDEFSKYIYLQDETNGTTEGLLGDLIKESHDKKWDKREKILQQLLTASETDQKGLDRRLIKHVQTLKENTPEDIDRLLVWVPEDEIVLKFVKDGKPQDIQTGSAGERVAGMLGLLLVLNEVPLIIDQPEDDLDTRLISNFVVPSFRKLKLTRQLILVTHNPNIAVNANSDNIIHMNFQSGQIAVSGNNALQDKEIRLAVCDVMEGGKDALNKRYYRISKALKA